MYLCFFQIPHEAVKETPAIQPLEEKEPVSLSADGQPNEAPYEEEPEEAEEEEEEPEGPGSEPEAPLEEISGEPAESGTSLPSPLTLSVILVFFFKVLSVCTVVLVIVVVVSAAAAAVAFVSFVVCLFLTVSRQTAMILLFSYYFDHLIFNAHVLIVET